MLIQWNNASVPLFKETRPRKRPEAVLCVRREGCSVCSLVLRSHCPHLHRVWDAGELLQLLFHPIPPPQPFCLRVPPPKTCLLSYELCIVITFRSLLQSLKSFCHSRLVTSPGTWEEQMPRGRSCRTCPPLPLAAATRRAAVPRQPQQPAQLPTACSTGKITGRAVSFIEKL